METKEPVRSQFQKLLGDRLVSGTWEDIYETVKRMVRHEDDGPSEVKRLIKFGISKNVKIDMFANPFGEGACFSYSEQGKEFGWIEYFENWRIGDAHDLSSFIIKGLSKLSEGRVNPDNGEKEVDE